MPCRLRRRDLLALPVSRLALGGSLPVSLRAAESAGPYAFRQEFDDAAAPLLRAQGGPFNPYFTYFGGHPQPDGPPGYRWWNDKELQAYTTENYPPAPYNPFRVRNGILTITAKPTPPAFVNSPKPYLSGALETSNGGFWEPEPVRAKRGGFEQKYGYFEARMRMPRGKGLWAAFWISGGIRGTDYKAGELDIVETVGDGRIYQTAHDWWAPVHVNDAHAHQPAWHYSDDFHTYALLWTHKEIVWFVDGVATRRAGREMVERYRRLCGPMYLSLNLGVGGGWPGPPDSETRFPATMAIDYVRARAA